MTRIAEPMTRNVIAVPPQVSLRNAWNIMKREGFRHLVVARDGLVLGILSDRDVLLVATRSGRELELPDVEVQNVMSPAPYVCRPTDSVEVVVRTMIERKIDAMPVLDAADRLAGLVTSTDLLLLLIRLDEAKAPLPFRFEWKELSALA